MIAVANAPCSWGVLEFESKAESPGYTQVLDEIRQSGYAGTELGDWGFMPTDPAALRERAVPPAADDAGCLRDHPPDRPIVVRGERAHRGQDRVAAVVGGHRRGAGDRAVRRAHRRSDSGAHRRTDHAGRWASTIGSGEDAARGVEQIARAVLDETGLRTVVHHHCATYVETPAEIDRLLALTDPALVGLCLDSGHVTYGGGDPRDVLARHRSRVWHVHFKDCEPAIAAQARAGGWDYQTALRHGLFCELGRGSVDFTGLLADLRAAGFDGWIVVEQDVLPAMGAPLASATRNREYLRGIGV